MTIYDVSEKAGVSIATVSRVLNGSDNVSAQTRQKVLAVIEACDYTPNAFARGLGLNSMNTIGILCADSSDLYLANAVYHIEQELRASNYNCILCCTGYDLSDKQKYLNLLVNKKVDSVILVGSNFVSDNDADNDYIRSAAAEIPVLLLNADFDCENVYCSLCDDFKSTMQATAYLLQTGVEDILYLYNSKSYSAFRKLSGYQSALTQKGIVPRMEYMQFFPGRNAHLPAIADFLAELDGAIRYKGIIAANDNLAIGAVKYAHKRGLRIPEDLSIVGYNNSILSVCCDPELTSVDNRLETLCHHIVNTLIGILDNREMPQKVIFSGELIKRGPTL
ncbi:MAG: LacI family transcriptional regulator [Lachnospiraceae bacterium]|nr:LacI family transcriptional regulator [Lachnospiraceae bacterium]